MYYDSLKNIVFSEWIYYGIYGVINNQVVMTVSAKRPLPVWGKCMSKFFLIAAKIVHVIFSCDIYRQYVSTMQFNVRTSKYSVFPLLATQFLCVLCWLRSVSSMLHVHAAFVLVCQLRECNACLTVECNCYTDVHMLARLMHLMCDCTHCWWFQVASAHNVVLIYFTHSIGCWPTNHVTDFWHVSENF